MLLTARAILSTASANRALALGKGDTNFEQNVQPNIVKALAGWK